MRNVFDAMSVINNLAILTIGFIYYTWIDKNTNKDLPEAEKLEEPAEGIKTISQNLVDDSDEEPTNYQKIKKILVKYINNSSKIEDWADSIIKIVGIYQKLLNLDIGSDIEEEDKDRIKLPLHKNEYLPWQGSVLEPQNPLSIATTISMSAINNPMMPAYAPTGIPQKDKEESKSRWGSHYSKILWIFY